MDHKEEMALITKAWNEYRTACYGKRRLPPTQAAEVRQAFLSGIHWLNTQDGYDPDAHRVCGACMSTLPAG